MVKRIKEKTEKYQLGYYDNNQNPIYKLVEYTGNYKIWDNNQILITKDGNKEFHSLKHEDFQNLHVTELHKDNNNNPVYEFKYEVVDNSYHLGDITNHSILDVGLVVGSGIAAIGAVALTGLGIFALAFGALGH